MKRRKLTRKDKIAEDTALTRAHIVLVTGILHRLGISDSFVPTRYLVEQSGLGLGRLYTVLGRMKESGIIETALEPDNVTLNHLDDVSLTPQGRARFEKYLKEQSNEREETETTGESSVPAPVEQDVQTD